MTMPPTAANNKPENIQSDVPAMYQASILYNPPTLGYYWGWCAYYFPEEIPAMLREVGEQTAEIALESFEVAIKAMGVHRPPPEERLQLYRAKSPELWMEQMSKFPWQAEKDMQDWEELEAKYGSPQLETLPEVEPEPIIQQEQPRKRVRQVIRNSEGRIDRVEEYEE